MKDLKLWHYYHVILFYNNYYRSHFLSIRKCGLRYSTMIVFIDNHELLQIFMIFVKE